MASIHDENHAKQENVEDPTIFGEESPSIIKIAKKRYTSIVARVTSASSYDGSIRVALLFSH